MKTRRDFLLTTSAGLCGLAAPLASFAQQQGRVWRVGFLGSTSPSDYASRMEALRSGLRDFGYREGKNIVIEFRWAEGKYDRLPKLASELARLNIDVIVTHGTPGSRAARQATTTIPIVLATTGDPIELGIAGSLARPGGNVTGSTILGREIMVKRLELLKEALPRASRLAVLLNPDNAGNPSTIKALEIAARSLTVEPLLFYARGPDEFEGIFLGMGRRRVDAVAISQEGIFIANVERITDIVTRRRLPSIGFTEIAEAGGLLAYGANIPEMFRRAAYFVDRILKGAKPGELPIEQPTKFELVVNMKTARTLGITIPQTVLVRADRVIE